MNEGDDNENEDEEGEGEDQGEGDGDGDGDGEGDGDGDGDGDDEGDGEGEGDDDGDEGGMDAEDSQQAEVPAQATQLDQNQAIASASGETNQAPLETLTELPEPSNVPSTLKPDTVDSEGRSLADASTPLEPAGSAAITHTEIPSNAMEISNVAPGHTEEGQGDLGTSDAGIAVKLPEPATGDVEMGEAPANAEVADSAPRVDEGLVHGESNLPEGLGDGAPPPEVEKQP
ncbi:hypothetical protein BD324DRAFT_411915 [Kockovaella imperatae]|uniref:Uncharacterized protein n=1 Tax=Kockovaella imperatae TaxID=4999 RepID=A0A1Y1UKB3_9TREE|nr:hypothetical protein BD324DRAFT_411915 [Kockovaella imperatae]ORX37977.1 hypothetical protein BD324DRAFT_411915 [Kockovaella imperatae]